MQFLFPVYDYMHIHHSQVFCVTFNEEEMLETAVSTSTGCPTICFYYLGSGFSQSKLVDGRINQTSVGPGQSLCQWRTNGNISVREETGERFAQITDGFSLHLILAKAGSWRWGFWNVEGIGKRLGFAIKRGKWQQTRGRGD